MYQRRDFWAQPKGLFLYYNLPSTSYRCSFTPLIIIVLMTMGDLLSKVMRYYSLLSCWARLLVLHLQRQSMLTATHNSLINNIYRTSFLGRRGIALKYFSVNSPTIDAEWFSQGQNCTQWKQKSLVEKVVTDDCVTVVKKTVLLTSPEHGTVAPKVFFWLDIIQRFLGASPNKVSYFFSH